MLLHVRFWTSRATKKQQERRQTDAVDGPVGELFGHSAGDELALVAARAAVQLLVDGPVGRGLLHAPAGRHAPTAGRRHAPRRPRLISSS